MASEYVHWVHESDSACFEYDVRVWMNKTQKIRWVHFWICEDLFIDSHSVQHSTIADVWGIPNGTFAISCTSRRRHSTKILGSVYASIASCYMLFLFCVDLFFSSAQWSYEGICWCIIGIENRAEWSLFNLETTDKVPIWDLDEFHLRKLIWSNKSFEDLPSTYCNLYLGRCSIIVCCTTWPFEVLMTSMLEIRESLLQRF